MTHPYKHHKEVRPGQGRAKEWSKHLKRGGKVHDGAKAVSKMSKKELVADERAEIKAEGKARGGRLDKRARGGGVKKHGKGHHTHINIMVAPKSGGADVPPPMGAGAGAPPPVPPMVPKAPMGPPMGAGPPGMPPGMPPPKPPGMMKRGGRTYSGISSKENIEHWAKRAGSNTRYDSGGRVAFAPPHMKGGAGGARGLLHKVKNYGSHAKITDGG